MLARIWHGVTPAEKADEYLDYLNQTGVPDYLATPGNRGAFVLRRLDGERAHFLTISLWDSLEAVKRFAGEDYERARYMPRTESFCSNSSRQWSTMNIMQIRMATPDDAYAVASTLQKAFLEFEPLYTPEAFATTISSPDQIRLRLNEGPIWVAIQDDMVVGTVSGAPKGDAIYIRGMGVDPAKRGSGVGR